MKFLGLHGSGTSGHVLDIQTSMLRDTLEAKSHQFHFIDAPCLCHAGPGVAPFFDGPYYAWWKNDTVTEVKKATEVLLRRMQAESPAYDAVLCFSQGCSILSSLILYHQSENPGKPLPFRSAIFICGGVPLYVLDTWIAVSENAKMIAQRNKAQLEAASADLPRKIEAMVSSGVRETMWDHPTAIWDGKDEGDRDGKTQTWEIPSTDATDVYGLDMSGLPRHLCPMIPTVHIYGHKDPICTSSLQLAMMCKPNKRLVYDHGGGHEIPRTTRVSKDIADAIQWLEKQLKPA